MGTCVTSPEDRRQGENGVWVNDEFADESGLLVLNVGANDDHGRIKQVDPVRVINCGLQRW